MASDHRLEVLDILEGFHLAHVLDCLHGLGVLESLSDPQTAESLAAGTELNPGVLGALLVYVAERTRLLERDANVFQLAVGAASLERLGFLLDQYVGAYGPNARRLTDVLRNQLDAGEAVDRERHASAFARLRQPSFPALPAIVAELQIRRLVDVGCGTGAFLIALAQQDDEFRGWGVEASAAMCATARQRIVAAGAAARIDVIQADGRDPSQLSPRDGGEHVEAITAASFLNELFGDGTDAVVSWLRRLSVRFPSRMLLVADYYGQLGADAEVVSHLGLLHDLVQVISGQGIPPRDAAHWERLYEDAGCRMLHCVEGGEGIPWFIHGVRLASES